MSTEIEKARLEFGAQSFYAKLSSEQYREASDTISAMLLAAQEASDNNYTALKNPFHTELYRGFFYHMKDWAEWMDQALNHEDDETLQKVHDGLMRLDEPFRSLLERLNGRLVGWSPDPMIAIACQHLEADFCKDEAWECDMSWYMQALDRFMASVIHWQNIGVALVLFTLAKDKDGATNYMKEMRGRIDEQLQFLYGNYHQVIKTFKRSWNEDIDTSREYWIQHCHTGKWVHRENNSDEVKRAWVDSGKEHDRSRWRFVGRLDKEKCSLINRTSPPGAVIWSNQVATKEYDQVTPTRPGDDWEAFYASIKPAAKDDSFRFYNRLSSYVFRNTNESRDFRAFLAP